MHKIPNKLSAVLGVVACALLLQPSSASETTASVASYKNNAVINSYLSSEKPRLALKKKHVVVESDGSLTPKVERIVDVLAAFESSVGAAVNMELVFAKDSIVLTAEGQETLGLIADTIRYQDVDVRVDLELPRHAEKGKAFSERRADEILRLLKSRYGVRNPLRAYITSPNASQHFYSVKGTLKGQDVQRLTFLNMGREG